MDDRKTLIERISEVTEETVSRVQQEVAQRNVVAATRERAGAVREKAQRAALGQLQLATHEDVARLQASLDRIEAAVNDLAKRVGSRPAPKPRAKPAAKPDDPE
jgi:hypothetical protein